MGKEYDDSRVMPLVEIEGIGSTRLEPVTPSLSVTRGSQVQALGWMWTHFPDRVTYRLHTPHVQEFTAVTSHERRP